MNILLVSDTHGRTEKLERLLEVFKKDVRLVCHMGDYGSDLRKFESKYSNLQLAAVNGNTDYAFQGQTEQFINISPRDGLKLRLLITHGHRFGVKRNLDRLFSYAKELGVNAVFFGHTHEDVCFMRDGIFFMNPGSLTFGRGGSDTYGLVRVSDSGEFAGEIIKYEG